MSRDAVLIHIHGARKLFSASLTLSREPKMQHHSSLQCVCSCRILERVDLSDSVRIFCPMNQLTIWLFFSTSFGSKMKTFLKIHHTNVTLASVNRNRNTENKARQTNETNIVAKQTLLRGRTYTSFSLKNRTKFFLIF